jgi:L-ascorbate metabolism protein UlaG (beta-lactamase superfamily)
MGQTVRFFILGVLFLSGSGSLFGETDTIASTGGEIRITPIVHGSVQLEYGDVVIQVDPWSRGDYTDAPKANLILVTDIHGDHLDPEAIGSLSQEGTEIVVSEAVAEQLGSGTVLANGESHEVAGVLIEAVPMYNLERGPEAGKLFHDSGRGNGYLLTMGGKRIYLAGDTACIPEMKALEDIDVAFVPMNLPYTMPPDEAAECVAAFKPGIVYPYHYRGSDLEVFKAGLADVPEVEVRIREWYPGS